LKTQKRVALFILFGESGLGEKNAGWTLVRMIHMKLKPEFWALSPFSPYDLMMIMKMAEQFSSVPLEFGLDIIACFSISIDI